MTGDMGFKLWMIVTTKTLRRLILILIFGIPLVIFFYAVIYYGWIKR
jgi:hypothetical protein